MESVMQWYYAKNGVQMGPVGIEELKAKLASGEVTGADMVWREGMPDWRKAAEVQELAVIPAAQSAATVSSDSQTPYSPPSANPVPQSYPGAPVPGSGKATTAMVLGIVAAVFAVCGCYGIMVSLPCGILAIVFGGQFKKEAELNPALSPEMGKARAGVILGWIAIGIALLITIGIIVFGFATGFMQEFSKMR